MWLDACVLYPSFLRDILLTVAEAEFYKPYWTEDILEEVKRNIVKNTNLPEEKIIKLFSNMNEAFPDALIDRAKYQDLIPVMQNDPKDKHVLAAEVAINAEIIVTNNLKDFPESATSRYEIEIHSADLFLLNQFELDPELIINVLRRRINDYTREPRTLDSFLERLKKDTPKTVVAIQDFLSKKNY